MTITWFILFHSPYSHSCRSSRFPFGCAVENVKIKRNEMLFVFIFSWYTAYRTHIMWHWMHFGQHANCIPFARISLSDFEYFNDHLNISFDRRFVNLSPSFFINAICLSIQLSYVHLFLMRKKRNQLSHHIDMEMREFHAQHQQHAIKN